MAFSSIAREILAATLIFMSGIVAAYPFLIKKWKKDSVNLQPDRMSLSSARVTLEGEVVSSTASFSSILFEGLSTVPQKVNLLHSLLESDVNWWQRVICEENFKFSSRLCNFLLPTMQRQVLVQVTSTEQPDERMVYLSDLTSFFRYTSHLKELTELNSQLLQKAPFGMLSTLEGKIVAFNQLFCELFDLDFRNLYQRTWLEVLLLNSSGEVNKILSLNKEQRQFQFEMEFMNLSNKKFWLQIEVKKASNKTEVDYMHWYFRDTTEGRAYAQHLQQAAVVFEASSDAIMIIDAKKRIKMINSAFSLMTGFSEQDVVGRNPQILGAEQKDIKLLESLWSQVESSKSWQGEIWKRKKDGSRYPEWMSLTAVTTVTGSITEYVLIASDMTERKQAEDRIRYQANYDPLTNLPNRNLFMDRLQRAITRSIREETSMALLFIDLDRFKFINDAFGHSVGDALLVKVARLLESCVRMSDTIARLGGDEFAIILSPIYGEKNAARVSSTIIEKLNKPIQLDGYKAVPCASIGICLYPKDGDTEEMLLKNADIAMYRAKEKGRNTYQFFTQEMQQQAQERTTLEAELRAAIGDEQLYPVYQPQLDCKTGLVGGIEVLMRWNPKDGKKMVTPDVFIPLAEDTGLIIPMGKWILEQACRQYKRWHEEGIAPNYIAVNVSGAQFKDVGFVDAVDEVLKKTGMDPTHLELELTESLLMEDHNYAVTILTKLHARDIKLSIDDFGTGFSSLAYLKAFPMDNLKIDQSFIRDILENKDNAAIVKAIVNLGHTLNMHIIVEGVETNLQMDLLKHYKVDYIQGYHYSKPMAWNECQQFLKNELPPG